MEYSDRWEKVERLGEGIMEKVHKVSPLLDEKIFKLWR